MPKRGPYRTGPFIVATDAEIPAHPMAQYLAEALARKEGKEFRSAGALAYEIAQRHFDADSEMFNKVRCWLRRNLKPHF